MQLSVMETCHIFLVQISTACEQFVLPNYNKYSNSITVYVLYSLSFLRNGIISPGYYCHKFTSFTFQIWTSTFKLLGHAHTCTYPKFLQNILILSKVLSSRQNQCIKFMSKKSFAFWIRHLFLKMRDKTVGMTYDVMDAF